MNAMINRQCISHYHRYYLNVSLSTCETADQVLTRPGDSASLVVDQRRPTLPSSITPNVNSDVMRCDARWCVKIMTS